MRIRQRFDYLITLLLLLSLLADPVLTPPLLAQNGASPTPPAAQTQFTLAPSVVQEEAATGAGTPAGRLYLPLVEQEADKAYAAAAVPPSSTVCSLYPIAISAKTLDGAHPGDSLADILNGTGPGNFGWLTWTGNTEVYALAASLTPPGNSSTYTNPYAATDHSVSRGDWVVGRPGVANDATVRRALDLLKTIDITVPVWGQATKTTGQILYLVNGFARVRLLRYQITYQ